MPALIEQSFKNGFVYTTALARIILTDARLQQSPSAAGFERNEQALLAFQATGAGITVPYFLTRQAIALAAAGQHPDAIVKANQAREQSEQWGEHWAGALTLFAQGQILAGGSAPDIERAQQAYTAAITLANRQQCVQWSVIFNDCAQKLTISNTVCK